MFASVILFRPSFYCYVLPLSSIVGCTIESFVVNILCSMYFSISISGLELYPASLLSVLSTCILVNIHTLLHINVKYSISSAVLVMLSLELHVFLTLW